MPCDRLRGVRAGLASLARCGWAATTVCCQVQACQPLSSCQELPAERFLPVFVSEKKKKKKKKKSTPVICLVSFSCIVGGVSDAFKKRTKLPCLFHHAVGHHFSPHHYLFYTMFSLISFLVNSSHMRVGPSSNP